MMAKVTWHENILADHPAFQQGYLRNYGVAANKRHSDGREAGEPDNPTATKTPKRGVLSEE